MIRWTVRRKILVSVGLTIFLAQALSTVVNIYGLKRSYKEALNLRFEALAQSIAADIIERDMKLFIGESQRDPQKLHTILQVASMTEIPRIYALNQENGLSSIAVIDPDGITATHTVQEQWGTAVDDGALKTALHGRRQVTIFDGETYYTLIPVFAEDDAYLGTIVVGALRSLIDSEISALLIMPLGLWVVFLVLILSLLAFFMRRIVIRPVTGLVTAIRLIETGDLNIQVPVTTHDEFGQLALAFNRMITQLQALVGQVQESGIQVTSSATELAATAKQQEITTATQVQSASRVLASVQDISDVTADLADTMQQVAFTSQETAGFASNGQADLARMEEAMRRMENASLSISSRLEAINEKAESITTVVITINKVAEQTNLLSLNASIEAEKAGEYGRGFMVVAREIRRLADQTAVATLDIEHMVHQMQSAVSSGVMEMDKFVAEVRQGAQDVERISLQLSRIIEQVQLLSPGFEDVNGAMEHQSQQAQEIRVAVQQLRDEMRDTNESLHETYSAVEQLQDVAVTLQQQVSQFTITSS